MKVIEICIVHKKKGNFPLVLEVSENMTFKQLVMENFDSSLLSSFNFDINKTLKQIGDVKNIFSKPIPSSKLKRYLLLHLWAELGEEEDIESLEEVCAAYLAKQRRPYVDRLNVGKLHLLAKIDALEEEEIDECLEQLDLPSDDFLKFSKYRTRRARPLHVGAYHNSNLVHLLEAKAQVME